MTKSGFEYAGTASHTKDGNQCKSWFDLKYCPGMERYNHEFPENNVTAAMNYCRNVDKDVSGPWCFTMNNEWEYCDIPICRETDKENMTFTLSSISMIDNATNIHNVSITMTTEKTQYFHKDCMTTSKGLDYIGNMSHTINGYKCQPAPSILL